VHAARAEELRVKSRRATREFAVTTRMRKWKFLFVIFTNARARFPLRHNFETWSKMGKSIVILQWPQRAACNVVMTSHPTLKFSTHGTSFVCVTCDGDQVVHSGVAAVLLEQYTRMGNRFDFTAAGHCSGDLSSK